MQNTGLLIKYKAATRGGVEESSSGWTKTPAADAGVRSLEVGANPWDQAHLAVAQNPEIEFAEPDLLTAEDFYAPAPAGETARSLTPDQVDEGKYIDWWSHPEAPRVWHLEKEFTQLAAAREEVKALATKKVVRIAHLDTGYSPRHISFPEAIINKELQRNFVEGEEDNMNNAEDPFVDKFMTMPGHGTGTLSILAGTKARVLGCDFQDYLGLYDSVEIVPIRIAASVVLLKSSAFVRALSYIVDELHEKESTRIHIITMSMGGVASRAWADLVNKAYEKGIFIVSAAGNNFKKAPTRTMVYPARFGRVVAACGATYDRSPYSMPSGKDSFKIMEGNFGPRVHMKTAVAAFTPNVPWAIHTDSEIVGIRGNGTSSATPQIAAAAALYYIKYHRELEALPQPWMKVEAIRHALFSSAQKLVNLPGNDYKMYYGNGIVQAMEMLKCSVKTPEFYKLTPPDKVSFPFLRLLFRTRSIEAPDVREEMLATELMQLLLTDPELQKILANEERGLDQLNDEDISRFIDAVFNNKNASDILKSKLAEMR